MFQSTKKPGNISSAFSSKSDIEWPAKFQALKDKISPTSVENSWNRLLASLETELIEIETQGSNIIPQIDFKEIADNGGRIPPNRIEEVRKRGVVVIRNVVDPDTALTYKSDVQAYIARNRSSIVGFPETNPQVWEVYWSKSQFQARSHPNFQLVTGAVNNLWKAEPGTAIDLSTNVTYCDRLRIRQPGDQSFALGEHIDGGSVERWEDPEYRKCYENILAGKWEEHDAFDATHRVDACMDLYNCSGGCAMFRSFQGWMSLSHVAPGGGTLRVCPLLKQSTAYIILRPFLSDVKDSPNMTGAIPGSQQLIPESLFPHIVQHGMVSIPKVTPGDCVFWHCDTIHAVESTCGSPLDSSVFYIPATPLCFKNAEYVARQKAAFVNGTSPPDFPLNNCEEKLEDRAHADELTDIGLLGMGFTKFPITPNMDQNAKLAAKLANQILFSENNV